MGTWETKVTLNHASLGGTGTNTWHIRTVASGSAAADDVASAMSLVQGFYGESSSMFPDSLAVRWDGTARGVLTSENDVVERDPWLVVGVVAGGILPPSQALCVNWIGESGDRSRRGRTFLGPASEFANQDNGTPSADVLNAVRGGATALVENSRSETGFALCVYSRQEGLFRDFVASSVRNQWASLRSRRD